MKLDKIEVDFKNGLVNYEVNSEKYSATVNSNEGFNAIASAMLRTGWDNKYVYSFTWLGRPIIQLPDDMIRIQEVIYKVKPDVIVETGVAHGGSLIYYASILKAMGKGRVIGIDIEIRPHNRVAIEEHRMFDAITLIEGDSAAEQTIEQVKAQIKESEKVVVFLDARHTKEHVLKELEAYSELVSPDSYIVAMDGIMRDLEGAPRADDDWSWNNPCEAALEFTEKNSNFKLEEPGIPFNEGNISDRVLTYWPSAYIRRVI
ncbi:CmcI family methyltransferase [Bowmanella denitrificans]|uniref:CmcI family methyltransferase n=1 Tax=Bowmanella denitrificans TaxID=366582 RepID=A0ABP3HB49_9ALTE